METNNEQRPSAALINREWYESAMAVLSPEELGRLLLNAIAYVLYGDELPPSSTRVGMVCRMIKPALDSDIIKYRERCARNAANARAGRERAAASGSESQRVGANTTSTPTPTTTKTPCLSSAEEEEKQVEREKWVVFGYF